MPLHPSGTHKTMSAMVAGDPKSVPVPGQRNISGPNTVPQFKPPKEGTPRRARRGG